MIDKKLTQEIDDFLNAPAGKRDLQKGALLVLKCTRNQILYANMMRCPTKFEAKMVYELKKAQQERLRRQAAEDALNLQKEVMPNVRKTLSTEYPPEGGAEVVDGETLKRYYGKRADHDSLSPAMQQLWDRNREVWQKIKALHEHLKTMDNNPPCDRLEYLIQMRELEAEHTKNFELYDSAKPLDNVERAALQAEVEAEQAAEAEFKADNAADDDEAPAEISENAAEISENKEKISEAPAADASKINAARKYISENRKKILTIEEEDKRAVLLTKIQERYDFLKSNGAGINDDVVEELKEIGVNV